MKLKLELEFPEIFITGKLPENWCDKSLIADGLVGWANCMVGSTIPENFGVGMALIGQKLGTATPNGLEELANKINFR